MTRVVVGVDRSAESRAALSWAFREAQLREARLEVVLSWGYLDQYRGRARFEPFYDAVAARRALDAFVAETLPEADASLVRPSAVDGFAADVLLDRSAGADLLVVGPRGTGGFFGLRLGSVSERCVSEAACPVAIVHRSRIRPAGALERVVVGVDGSDGSGEAMRWAVDECIRRGAELEVVHAWMDPAPSKTYSTGAVSAGTFEAAAWRAVDRALEADGLDLDALPKAPERSVIFGAAGAALTDAAERADLVVVGSRGLSRFKRLLLGSVASEVARHAPAPVVVVRPRSLPE